MAQSNKDLYTPDHSTLHEETAVSFNHPSDDDIMLAYIETTLRARIKECRELERILINAGRRNKSIFLPVRKR